MTDESLQDQYLTKLSECRQRLQGVRLSELATASGVSQQHLWNIRQGRQQPSNRVLDAVWNGLKVLDEAEREAQ